MALNNYQDADFTPSITPSDARPSMGTYNTPQTFRFWCQKVLPLVYDDSLSYYELLCKVVDYLNNTMEDVNTAVEDVTNLNSAFGSLENHVNASETALLQAYTDLQSYVNTYFNNLDVQEEINNKLDVMASDGTLDALLLPYFNEYKEEIDSDIYNFKTNMNNRMNVLDAELDSIIAAQQGGTLPDNTEIIDGRVGANGKTYSTLGDAIRGQVSEINYQTGFSNNLFDTNDYTNAYIDTVGNIVASTGNILSDYYELGEAEKILIRTDVNMFAIAINEFDENKVFIKRNSYTGVNNVIYAIPNNVKFCRIVFNYNNVADPKTSVSTTNPNLKFFTNLFVDMPKMSDKIDDIDKELSNINYQTSFSDEMFDVSDYTNAYIDGSGNIVSLTSNILSPLYDVSNAEKILIRTDVNMYAIVVSEFDSNESFIRRTAYQTTKNVLYTKQDNTNYIRIVFNYNNVADPKLNIDVTNPSIKAFKNLFVDVPDVESIESDVDILYNITEDGENLITLDDFEQYGNEKRIWYNTTEFPDGTIIKIVNPLYDVGIANPNNQIPNWQKEIVIDSNYTGKFGIRKIDVTDISALSQIELKGIVKVGRFIYQEDGDFGKYLHFSFDDCTFWTDLIVNEATYTSAFQNSFLKDIKGIHDVTGVKFTLNCFCSTDDYDIANVPNKFADEFKANSDWLKFAFHAEDDEANYSTDDVTGIVTSYNKFITAILKMTGTLDCIDTVVRLGFFSGTLNNCIALRDANCGITGLLTADDTRVSYYLNTADNNYILNHAKFYDADNKLMFIKTQQRVDYVQSVSDYCNNFLTASYGNMYKYVELFMHQYNWNAERRNNVCSIIYWFENQKYKFDYWSKILRV